MNGTTYTLSDVCRGGLATLHPSGHCVAHLLPGGLQVAVRRLADLAITHLHTTCDPIHGLMWAPVAPDGESALLAVSYTASTVHLLGASGNTEQLEVYGRILDDVNGISYACFAPDGKAIVTVSQHQVIITRRGIF